MPVVMQRSTVAIATFVLLVATACASDATTSGSSVPGTAPGTPLDPAEGPAPGTAPGTAPGLPSANVPLPAVMLEQVTTLDAPIDTAVLPDGTVLVAERAGRVRVLIPGSGGPGSDGSGSDGPGSDGSTAPGPAPLRAGDLLLDVSDRTTTDGERGLLSIAVRPDGSELFLSLTDVDGDTLVEAHPLDGPRITGPPRTIYTLAQPRANHNGGPIVFTPDGLLLLGLGDGGGRGDPQGAAQDLSTPLGAVIRLDVSGDGPGLAAADNPFVGRTDAAPEIAAYGLRNPWRMTLDMARGELWIADVGQSAREEINRVTLAGLLGANFGWALREGDTEFRGDEPADHVGPLHAYAHDPGCAITGGLVYRGTALPGLVGTYVFTDLCEGELRVLLDDGGEVVSRPLGVSGERIIGFGEDAAGELLVLEIGGRVLRLVPA
jgi:glucose/arabinose dehydrogenase